MPVRVLIADPDETLLASYHARLSQAGLAVATVRNGLDCLEMLRRFKPDVLVLEPDILWGGGDGILAVMHDVFELPLVPVFIITSRATFASLHPAEFPLVAHMQTKPVEPGELVRLIRHIADEPKPREEDLLYRTLGCDRRTKRSMPRMTERI